MKPELEELEEMEEQLVLLYKFVSQYNALKKFYYEGVDIKPSFEDETGILNELVGNEDSEEVLKTCIIEVEEEKGSENIEFHEILDSYNMEELHKKYGMSGVEDIGKIDIKRLISSL